MVLPAATEPGSTVEPGTPGRRFFHAGGGHAGDGAERDRDAEPPPATMPGRLPSSPPSAGMPMRRTRPGFGWTARRTPSGPAGPRRNGPDPPAKWSTASLRRPEKGRERSTSGITTTGSIAATRRTAGQRICRSAFRLTRMCWRWNGTLSRIRGTRKKVAPPVFMSRWRTRSFITGSGTGSRSTTGAGGGRDRQGRPGGAQCRRSGMESTEGTRVRSAGRDGAPPYQ